MAPRALHHLPLVPHPPPPCCFARAAGARAVLIASSTIILLLDEEDSSSQSLRNLPPRFDAASGNCVPIAARAQLRIAHSKTGAMFSSYGWQQFHKSVFHSCGSQFSAAVLGGNCEQLRPIYATQSLRKLRQFLELRKIRK